MMRDLAARFLARQPLIAALINFATVLPLPGAGVQRGPVLLVHGFSDSAVSMNIIGQRLARSGWKIYTMSLVPSDGSASLENLAGQLAAYIDQTFPNRSGINLVGFSMGGIVCRYYVQKLDPTHRVERFVTISAPHHGTWTAYLSKKAGCVEMRPGSAFLNSLNSDLDRLRRVRFMSLWTPLDLVILPASSSRMSVGRQTRIWAAAHPLMILQRQSIDTVELFLEN
jgi:triacylglycerol lipase